MTTTSNDLTIPPFLDRRAEVSANPGDDTTNAPATARTVLVKPKPSWRDHLPVHPAANLFPKMSEAELRELGEDIKKNGLLVPVVVWKNDKGETLLLDGRNRLAAMELVGQCVISDRAIHLGDECYLFDRLDSPVDPYAYVIAANLHRRQLTDEERRKVIAKIIKAKPEASDRVIAKTVKRNHKTVAKVRREMESTGEVSPVEKRVGADGKARPKKKKARAKKKLTKSDSVTTPRDTGTQVIPVEERRAAMTALDSSDDDQKADDNPIWIAWCKASPEVRLEFVKLMQRERARIVGAAQ
jgi:hypothetical protein